MSFPSIFCIVGYAIAQALIVRVTGSGDFGQVAGWSFVIPIGLYCGMLDQEGR